MKKIFIQKIMALALISLLLNARSKTDERSMVSKTFDVCYSISHISPDIKSISYNDAMENTVQVSSPADFSFGMKKITVSADSFHARLCLVVDNPTSHPVSFRIEILSASPVIVSKDFTLLPMTSATAACIEQTLLFRD